MTVINKLYEYIKKETVLMVAAIVACISIVFVPFSNEYFDYIDLRVLSILFCLMAVISGFQQIGVFEVLAKQLLKGVKNTRQLAYILVMLCFFTSMWITNDVSLIAFVPFSILVLTMIKKENLLIYVIVMQTIGANLGSMLTPVGNPQNLYLYSFYKLSPLAFFQITVPLVVVSFFLLCISLLFVKKEEIPINWQMEKLILGESQIKESNLVFTESNKASKSQVKEVNLVFTESNKASKSQVKEVKLGITESNKVDKNQLQGMIEGIDQIRFLGYLILFFLCLATVFHLVPYTITLIITCITLLMISPRLYTQIDYSLLATFVCFFIFVGNMERMEVIKKGVEGLIRGREILASILVSQGISNVPAAVLLSSFTKDAKSLIIGTNVGGLGTLIASLASLISYKFYSRYTNAQKGRYLITFTKYNIIYLGIIIILIMIIY